MMKRSLGAEEWIRRGLGVAVLLGVIAIAFGWDRGILQRVSLASTSDIEQGLVDRIRPSPDASSQASPTTQSDPVMTASGAQAEPSMMMSAHAPEPQLTNEGSLPSLAGAVAWLNSAPLTRDSLRGKVVVIDFWTYSCINCLRSIPYIEAWSEKYKNDGLVVIGVHTRPNLHFEERSVQCGKGCS